MSAYKHSPFPALACFAVSRCIGTCLRTYPPVGGIAPGRAKYTEHKRSLCDGCISLSNAEGFIRCYLPLSCSDLDFLSWAYPPFLFARIRAYLLSLTVNRLFTFLSALFLYSCPDILQIATIRRSHQIPFHCRIHLHPCPYPLVIHQNFHTLSAVKSRINP